MEKATDRSRARARDRDRAGLVLGACALGGMDEVDGVEWTVENAHALVARATATTATTVTTATTASEGNIFSRTRRVVLRRIIARARERPMFLYVIAFVYQYVLCQLLSLCTLTKNCENMSSHRRVARESVLVVLAFSMICFEVIDNIVIVYVCIFALTAFE